MELAMNKEMTSEEKLLKIIKKKNDPARDKVNVEVQNAENKEHKKDGIDFLKIANALLISVILVIMGYILFHYQELTSAPVVKVSIGGPDAEPVTNLADSVVKELQPFDFYRQTIERRDVFLSPWEKVETPENVATQTNNELKNELKLVGVLLDKKPQAVIENIRENKTYFVGIGDKVGEAQIKTIEEGKVTLMYREEKVELTQQ